MIVCTCHGITDGEIRRVAAECGKDVAAVTQRCRAGTSCGGCRPTVQALIQRAELGERPRQALDERR